MITIKDGKFYQDGKEVKPEFGNWQQIRALQAALRESNLESCSGTVVSEEVSQYYPIIVFKCPLCNTQNRQHFEDDVDEYHIDNSDVDGYEVSCTQCNTDFTVKAKKDSPRNKITLLYDKPEEE
jgi:hypothetical protein